MPLKSNVTIAGSRYHGGPAHVCGWASCSRLALEGMGDAVDIAQVSTEEGTWQDVLERQEVPSSSAGLIPIFQHPHPGPSPFGPCQRSAQHPAALQR